MMKNLLISLRAMLFLTIITGVCYPLLITGIAQTLFPFMSNGSLALREGKVIGSTLIGQSFEGDRYFSPRPSATGYSTMPSGGSNLGPTSKALTDSVKSRTARFIGRNGAQAVPQDMITTSASGLDPHISPAGAYAQVQRIAHARGLDSIGQGHLMHLVREHIEARRFGIFGEPRVNVLLLNLALDSVFPSTK
jgi:potassium-transporting ATPase KdpC subunit